jgi:hypothetical protein
MKSTTAVLAILAAVVCSSVVSSQSGSGSLTPGYIPVCSGESYSQTPYPPIPTLPNQFYTAVELSYSEKNRSYVLSEHYDDPGNRARLDYVWEDSGEPGVEIYDYDLGEAFLIPDRERNVACGVKSLEEPSSFLNNSFFRFRYVNGSIHVGSVKDMFDLAGNQSARNCPQKKLRGILCDCWETCHNFDNYSYTVTYYFASSELNYYFPGEATIPVQINVHNASLENDGTLSESRITYSFFGFHSGPSAVPDSAFEVPTGLPCLGRISGKDLPQVSQYFSMHIESVVDANTVTTEREFYDSQLFRVDFLYESTPYSVIHDFELGLQYIINRRLSNCSIYSIANLSYSSYDIAGGPDGAKRMRTPTEFFRVGAGYNFSYEGVTKIRGIEAEAWISVRDSFPLNLGSKVVNGTVELFYSRPGSTLSSLLSNETAPVPLAINLIGTLCYDGDDCGKSTSLSSFSTIYDFSTTEPDFDVFDTSFCAEPGQYRIISMKIPGHEFGADIGQLRRSIRLGLTEYAKLSLLQVASIEVVGEDDKYIYVTLQILPVPSAADYPDPRSPDDVVQDLRSSTTSDDCFPFTIQLPSSGEKVRPCWVRVDPVCPTTTTSGEFLHIIVCIQ